METRLWLTLTRTNIATWSTHLQKTQLWNDVFQGILLNNWKVLGRTLAALTIFILRYDKRFSLFININLHETTLNVWRQTEFITFKQGERPQCMCCHVLQHGRVHPIPSTFWHVNKIIIIISNLSSKRSISSNGAKSETCFEFVILLFTRLSSIAPKTKRK